MSAYKFRILGLALLVASGLASTARAQLDDYNSPFYGPVNDLQWFDPVDLDISGLAGSRPVGFFFDYDKLYWTESGERIEVGDPLTVQRQFRIYGGVPTNPDTGLPINRALLTNSIQTGVPSASFAFGERYEFGFWGENDRAWVISVLDGPDSNQSITLGLDGGAQEGQGGLQSPLGDVFVAFRTEPGNMAGWLDFDEGADFTGILFDDTDGDGILDGDGFADDINENAQHGGQFFDLLAPGNEPETEGDVLPDYGDLVTLTTAFRNVTIRNSTKVNGFELMRAHRLKNDHFLVKNQNNFFEFYYGARFLQLDDNFVFDGQGGLVLGDSFWDTTIENNIVGPQVGYTMQRVVGRWTFESKGKFLLGYNNRDWRQSGFIGEDLTPSRANHPLFLRAKSFEYGKNDDDLSPVGELRLDLRYRITDNVRLNLGWTGTYIDNIKRAATHIDYVLYDETGKVMGFNDNGTEEIFMHGVNFGIELNQ